MSRVWRLMKGEERRRQDDANVEEDDATVSSWDDYLSFNSTAAAGAQRHNDQAVPALVDLIEQNLPQDSFRSDRQLIQLFKSRILLLAVEYERRGIIRFGPSFRMAKDFLVFVRAFHWTVAGQQFAAILRQGQVDQLINALDILTLGVERGHRERAEDWRQQAEQQELRQHGLQLG